MPGSSRKACYVTFAPTRVVDRPTGWRSAVSDALSQDDRDACARAAFAEIEAVLERRCPEIRVAFWAAVDRLYRLDVPPSGPFEALSEPRLDVRLSAQDQ